MATTAIAGTRQTLRVGSATTPFASLGLIADPCRLHTEIHDCPILLSYMTFASSRSSVENGTGQARRVSTPARVYTRFVQPTHHVARPYTNPVCGHTAPKELVAVVFAGQLHTPSHSIERPFQVYLTQRIIQLKRRHSNSNTTPKYCPTSAHSHQSPPQRPHATLLHTHTAPIDVNCSA